MATNYAGFSVIALDEVWFMYLRQVNFAFLLSESLPSALLSNFNVVKHFLLPLLLDKYMGSLFQGLCMLSVSFIEIA